MLKQTSNNPSGLWKIFLLFIIVGAAALIISPVSAETGVTIAAGGDQSYYLGEKVVFSGHNYDSDSTYLFITGPGISNGGGKLTSPQQDVVSGNSESFTVVKTKPDKTWEYVYYTHNLNVDAGSYTIYAVSQPETKDQLGSGAGNVPIILKKPFITAELSPATISKGEPFTVFGFAEGIPESVQIWILGKNFSFEAIESVNSDASYKYEVPQEVTSQLANGQYFVIVQHPMADNQFDFVVSGDYVRNQKLNTGTNVFKLTGPGSLQGSDAADALIAAISSQEANDHTLSDDTYAIVPFQVTDAGSPTALPAPLQFAPFGALVLILGIAAWKRH